MRFVIIDLKQPEKSYMADTITFVQIGECENGNLIIADTQRKIIHARDIRHKKRLNEEPADHIEKIADF